MHACVLSPRRCIAAVAAVAVLMLAAAAPAVAAPVVDGTFPVDGSPGQIAAAADGNVWFVVTGNSAMKELGRITPSGAIDYFDTPNNEAVTDIAAAPARLWMPFNGGIVEWDPVAGSGTSHAIATINQARGAALDGDGNIWVADSADGLVEVAPNGVKVQDVAVGGASGRGITLGDDGRMWWADFSGSIRATGTGMAPATATFAVGGTPQEIGAGPAGLLAFGNPGTNPQTVGRVTTAGGVQTTPSPGSDPFGVAFGTDGAWWFALFASSALGRLTTDGALTTLPLAAGSGPRQLTVGPQNTLWVALETGNSIARVSGVLADPPASAAPGTPSATPPTVLPVDAVAPTLTGIAMSARRFRVGPARTAVAAGRTRPRRPPRGTTVTWRLSEAALTRLRIERRSTGRRLRGRCVAPSRRLRRARRCVRWRRAGTLTRRRGAGLQRLRWSGRIGTRALRPGRYRIVLSAVDTAGNRSRTRTLTFRIVR
jgi:virginiamycin B lyase